MNKIQHFSWARLDINTSEDKLFPFSRTAPTHWGRAIKLLISAACNRVLSQPFSAIMRCPPDYDNLDSSGANGLKEEKWETGSLSGP